MENFTSDIREIRIADYNYDLPHERIASEPAAERDSSRLLVYRFGQISDTKFTSLPDFVESGALMVFNDTKVIHARVLFQKPTGAVIEIFCLEPYSITEVAMAMQAREAVSWKCLIGGAAKWKKGQILTKQISIGDREIILQATYLSKLSDCFVIGFSWTPGDTDFATLLSNAGLIPLPPYLRRLPNANDKVRYQTIYADHDGSVAAPTAGLHFTHNTLENLAAKKIDTAYVTLHVGAGTFKPVKSDKIGDHEMHAESIQVSKQTILRIRERIGQQIIAVGTTSLRTLESLYWLGQKIIAQPQISFANLFVEQWECYTANSKTITPEDALDAVLDFLERNNIDQLNAVTQLMIAPGYEFRIVAGLVTNFHQPQSTLLLIIAALIGEDWKTVYKYAADHNYRFLSYGDASLLLKKSAP